MNKLFDKFSLRNSFRPALLVTALSLAIPLWSAAALAQEDEQKEETKQVSGISDSEYLPIVRVIPVYPSGIAGGSCDMEFTVKKNGNVTDAVATKCSSSVIKRATIKAVLKWKYKPRTVNGKPVDTPGVMTKVVYQSSDSIQFIDHE